MKPYAGTKVADEKCERVMLLVVEGLGGEDVFFCCFVLTGKMRTWSFPFRGERRCFPAVLDV